MNNLTLFLYLAGITTQLQVLLIVVASISGFGLIFLLIQMDIDGYYPNLGKWARRVVIISAVSFFIAATIPNSKTMYLMASSEIGKQILQTDEAKVIYNDLRQVLSEYANAH